MDKVQEQIEYWQSEIRRAVSDELEHTSWVFENFAERIFSNIRWGFFRFQKQDHTELGWKQLLELNLPEFHAYEKLALSQFYDLFAQRMFGDIIYEEDALTSLVLLHFEYEDHYAVVGAGAGEAFTMDPDAFFAKWSLLVTLPPPYIVFGLDEYYNDVQEWQWEYIDAYEQWMNKHNEKFRYKYLQVGGWADFRQDGDYDRYIAHAETEHGDFGAVYLEYYKGKFHGYDQMC